jgi:acetyl-CoA acetyltransferase
VSDLRLVAAAQSPYTRHPPSDRAGEDFRTETVLADAVVRALAQAGFHRDDVDGLGVAAFTLAPDHAIDLAWRLGMRLRWLMEDTNGGACGPNLLQHAVRAIEAGDAEVVMLVAGDHVPEGDYGDLIDNYNGPRATTWRRCRSRARTRWRLDSRALRCRPAVAAQHLGRPALVRPGRCGRRHAGCGEVATQLI